MLSLLHPTRTVNANRRLGYLLAAIAGAVNAGGFLAVAQYTSHVTGILSSVADHLVVGEVLLALKAALAVVAFFLGAMTCAMLVGYGRRHGVHSLYALPLLLEVGLVMLFGLMGASLPMIPGLLVPVTVILLCFIMGLQNAVVTDLSKAVIRTTHMTGIVTDLGIELGKALYWNRSHLNLPPVRSNRAKLRLLGGLLAAFVLGGITGALGFQTVGYGFTLPIAALLLIICLPPLFLDWRERRLPRNHSTDNRAQ